MLTVRIEGPGRSGFEILVPILRVKDAEDSVGQTRAWEGLQRRGDEVRVVDRRWYS